MQARGRVEGGKRDENDPQALALFVTWPLRLWSRGMSRFGKEVRGLLFPLIARSDIEEMTKDW